MGMIGGLPGGGKAGGLSRIADAGILACLAAAGLLLCGRSALSRRAALDAAVPPPGAGEVVHRVDMDAAGEAELQLLPGVGPRLAGRIVEERAARGPFASPDDLDRRVPGIGPSHLRWWRGRVVKAPEGAGR